MSRGTPLSIPPGALNPEQAGEYLGGVAAGTLSNWRVQGRGPQFTRVEGHVVYRVRDLDAYLEAGVVRNNEERIEEVIAKPTTSTGTTPGQRGRVASSAPPEQVRGRADRSGTRNGTAAGETAAEERG